jgi:hydrogenase/urease accessory protein HupE
MVREERRKFALPNRATFRHIFFGFDRHGQNAQTDTLSTLAKLSGKPTGGMLGLLGVPLPGTEIGIAASAILLGAAVMLEGRPPIAIAAVVVSFFAIFHGYAHGTELPTWQSGLLYSIGFVLATGCLHGMGITIGLVQCWLWGRNCSA